MFNLKSIEVLCKTFRAIWLAIKASEINLKKTHIGLKPNSTHVSPHSESIKRDSLLLLCRFDCYTNNSSVSDREKCQLFLEREPLDDNVAHKLCIIYPTFPTIIFNALLLFVFIFQLNKLTHLFGRAISIRCYYCTTLYAYLYSIHHIG